MNAVRIAFCYIQLIGITHVITVLMGAPVFTDIFRTLFFSIYLVSIGFTPIIFSLQGNLTQIYQFVFHDDSYGFRNFSKIAYRRFLMKNLIVGTIFGAWLGAIPIPLDWDRWWQRWPITCLVSSTLGALLSLPISYLYSFFQQSNKINKNLE